MGSGDELFVINPLPEQITLLIKYLETHFNEALDKIEKKSSK